MWKIVQCLDQSGKDIHTTSPCLRAIAQWSSSSEAKNSIIFKSHPICGHFRKALNIFKKNF